MELKYENNKRTFDNTQIKPFENDFKASKTDANHKKVLRNIRRKPTRNIRNMKKVKIGENTKANEQFVKDIKLKIDSFKTLVEYVHSFNENVEIIEVYKRPFEYAIELTTSNYKSDFKNVIIDKVFELIGFSVTKLQELCTPFEKVEHEFDPLTLEYEAPDFNIYITTPQQHVRLNSTLAICKAVDQLIEEGTPLHMGSIIQGLRGVLQPDYANHKLQPNKDYILTGAKALYRGM